MTQSKIKQMITGLAALLTVAATPTAAIADFYDGFRGPQTFQLDQRFVLSFDDGKVDINYTLLPKAFIDADNNGTGAFAVAPLSYTPGYSPTAGVGGGGFIKLSESSSLLGVIPVLYRGQHRTVTVTPTVYGTFGIGNVLVDPRISYAAVIRNGTIQHNANAGATLGYKHENIIVGLDAEVRSPIARMSVDSLIERLAVQGIIRIDLDSDHANWIQTYLSPASLTCAWRTNF